MIITDNTSKDPARWDSKQADQWFEKGEWLNGWSVKPDSSINRKALAVSYFRNRDKWDKAFAFLKKAAIKGVEPKKYDIDNEQVYAVVSSYVTKNKDDAKYETHKKYIDIQYVYEGKELIGLTAADKKQLDLFPYDPERDIEFITVSEGRNLRATPENFFIFFPDDAHCPGLKDGENAPVSKIVVKVRVE